MAPTQTNIQQYPVTQGKMAAGPLGMKDTKPLEDNNALNPKS